MYNAAVYIFILFFFINGRQCTSNENRESWINHSHLVYSFKCQNPQARSFELTELFEKDDPIILQIENVWPASTVLHRCENAGCCTGIKQCAPKETETVELIFGIVQSGLSKVDYVHRKVVNHTLCACEKDNHKVNSLH